MVFTLYHVCFPPHQEPNTLALLLWSGYNKPHRIFITILEEKQKSNNTGIETEGLALNSSPASALEVSITTFQGF